MKLVPPCEGCEAAALDAESGLYIDGCSSCSVRAISQAPAHARQAFYRTIVDDQARADFIAAVQTEHARRKAAA